MSSNIRVKRKCAYCHNEFIAKTTTTQTCSDTCAKRLYKEKKKKEKIEASNIQTKITKLQLVADITTKPILNVSEAACLLGVSIPTINRLIKDGKLKSFRLGKRQTRIKRIDIDKVISKQSND